MPLAPSLTSQLPQGFVWFTRFGYNPDTVGAGLPAMGPVQSVKALDQSVGTNLSSTRLTASSASITT
ncbi:hypothetical protein SRM1_05394 [Pseudomonas fluorescens]|nr:hypothetical protein SRM1_05394 [Pseudomonas fluorescens]